MRAILSRKPNGRQGRWIALAAAGVLTASLAGCGAKLNPRITSERQRLVLADEPAGATSILAAKKQLPEGGEVTLIGKIGDGEDDPFEKNQAAFFLCELPTHDHAGHDAANCPFCKHRAAETPRVVVQFVDDAGRVLPIDSRELLGVKKGQVVVVRGQGRLNDALDVLVVTASGIHIRR